MPIDPTRYFSIDEEEWLYIEWYYQHYLLS